VPEHPRLDDLIRLAYRGADYRNWIFQRNPAYGRIEQQPYKIQSLLLDAAFSLCREVPRPRNGKMRARGVRHHQIPAVSENVSHIALIVRPWRFGRQQIATHRVMPQSPKRIADFGAVFTRNKHPHRTLQIRSEQPERVVLRSSVGSASPRSCSSGSLFLTAYASMPINSPISSAPALRIARKQFNT
jgi:hypothetical protein